MHPILFQLFDYPVKTYGVFVALAHVIGILGMLFIVRRRSLPLEPYIDMVFVVLVAGFLGGRFGYWIDHPGEIHGVGDFIRVDHGGLSFFGGLATAFPAFLAYLLLRDLPVWETADIFAPLLPLSLAVLRLGCFGAGCCHGLPTNLPWAVRLSSSVVPVRLRGVPLHPTQLYESCFLFLLTAVLITINRFDEEDPWPSGSVATLCLGAYGIYRLAFDIWRGDMSHNVLLGFTFSQCLALLLVAIAAAVGGYLAYDPSGEE